MLEQRRVDEELSRFIDGSLDSERTARLIERLCTDEELKAAWASFHTIGHVMRNPGVGLVDPDFVSRVSRAVESEPVVLLPRKSAMAEETIKHRFVTVALAASLSVIAVLVGQSVTNNAVGLATRSSSALADNGGQGESTIPLRGDLAAESRFDDYLLMHNETAYMAGSAGFMPYARVVSARMDR